MAEIKNTASAPEKSLKQKIEEAPVIVPTPVLPTNIQPENIIPVKQQSSLSFDKLKNDKRIQFALLIFIGSLIFLKCKKMKKPVEVSTD